MVVLLLSAACGGSAEEVAEPAPGPAVELSALNLQFAALPSGFEVGSQTADSVELVPTDPEADGRMWLEFDEISDYGIDLVQVVTDQGAAYELRENSEYFGGRKLVVAAAGEAYYVRGRYDEDGRRVEETRLFLIHPSENRLVSMHYAYPAGEDSSDRIQELFAWVGELEVTNEMAGADEVAEP